MLNNRFRFIGIMIFLAIIVYCDWNNFVKRITEHSVVVPPQKLLTPNAYEGFKHASIELKFANDLNEQHDVDYIRKLVAGNAESIKEIRENFRYQFQYPRQSGSLHTDVINANHILYLFKYRSYLFVLDGKNHDINSVESYYDALQYCMQLLHIPDVATASRALDTQRQVLKRISDDCLFVSNAETTRREMVRLHQISSDEVSCAEYFIELMYYIINEQQQALKAKYLKHDPRYKVSQHEVNVFSKEMEATISMMRLPYLQQQKPFFSKNKIYTRYFKPCWREVESLQFAFQCVETHYVLLHTMYAINLYALDHKVVPYKLHDLVPKYISAVPRDPILPTRELSYYLSKKGVVLYSVGPDGVDDHGKPIENIKPIDTKDAKHWKVMPDSKGDFVEFYNW